MNTLQFESLHYFPENIIAKRISKLRELLVRNKIDAILITKKENYMYFSGFSGTFALLIITLHHSFLITDSRYISQAYSQCTLYKILELSVDDSSVIAEIINETNIHSLAFEENHITYKDFCKYRDSLPILEKDFIPASDIIIELRAVKDHFEIDYIRKAVEIADNTFNHILKFITPGIEEQDIATEIECFMKKQGASGNSFETIVASGQRSSFVHGVATSKKIQTDELIILDFGAVYKGYCSDMSRTIFIGDLSSFKHSKKLRSMYNIVLESQRMAIENIRPGLTGCQVDSIARDYIAHSEYSDYFLHSLGHGVGLEVHEYPRLSSKSNTVLKNNMIVTIEPGIYVPGVGGIRIEDIVVVNDDMPVVLTKSDKSFLDIY